MNTRSVPVSLSVALAAALCCSAPLARDVRAQTPTDTKIRLMAEALRARDAGDLTAAQAALTRLAALSPDDRAVQRLRAEVEAQARTRRGVAARRDRPD